MKDLLPGRIREEFILPDGLALFNSASCGPVARATVRSAETFYATSPMNYRSGVTPLEQQSNWAVDAARSRIARLINAPSPEQVVFTKNTTEGINNIAEGLEWSPGDEIVVSVSEHQSNILPWMRLERTRGVKVKFITPVGHSGLLDPQTVASALSRNTKLVSFAHLSNSFGCIQEAEEITKVAHDAGALVVVDGAQSLGRMRVDVSSIGCDFFVSCGRKALLGPQGVGIMWGRSELLSQLEPLIVGGQSADMPTDDAYTLKDIPFRFEAGIINTTGAIGLGEAISFLENLGFENVWRHIGTLARRLIGALSDLPHVTVFGPSAKDRMSGIVAWSIDGLAPQHVADSLFTDYDIVTTAGVHGSPPGARFLGIEGLVRAGIHCFNTSEDIERLISAVSTLQRK